MSSDYARIREIKDGRRRLNECEKICKKKNCGGTIQEAKTEGGTATGTATTFGCGASQPSYLKDKLGIKIRWDEGNNDDEERKDTNTNSFSAQDALEILKKISRNDVDMLGLDPGRNLIPYFLVFTI